MGLRSALQRKTNVSNFIQDYVKERKKEKRVIDQQIKRLDAQLQNNTIDKYTYERLRDLLEINLFKQQEEALEKLLVKISK